MGKYVRKGIKRGVKQSEQTKRWCDQIVEELKKGDKSSYELEQMFGIKENQFPAVLLQLTYVAPIYDYKIRGKLFLALMK